MKKLMIFALVVIMTLALAVPAFAADRVLSENKVGFHCGCEGGNGSVTPLNYYDTPEWLVRIDDVTWELESKDYACPKCGNTDWVSFSNKSGVFDGKNVQVYRKGDDPPPPQPSGIIANGNASLTTTTETILQKWQRELTPYQTITQYVSDSFSSVTATYVDYLSRLDINEKNGKVTEKSGQKVIVPNSNHFTYAAFTLAELQAGVDLALVVGNKLDYVGAASIKINANGKLELSISDKIFKSAFGFVAFNDSFTIPKNGNIHSDKLFGGHNSNTVFDLPAAGKDGKIYIYVHFDNLTYDLGVEESAIEWIVTKDYELKLTEIVKTEEVTTAISGVTYTILDAAGNDVTDEAADLEPGLYTVVFYDPYINEFITFADVEVIYGEFTTVTYSANYFENAAPIFIDEYLPDIENPLVIINKTVKVK